ncbi:metalloprotease [Aestuariivirga sp.]|uniref:metalloprotease n=1 Tax=Aestuariivirga sp. TaxID=2650926 RepID=UPI003919B332
MSNLGHELPLILLLIALLGLRVRVTPRARIFIAAPPEKVFALVDFSEGETQRWQRTRVRSMLVDPASRTYKLSFTTPLATGAVQSGEALFRVSRRDVPFRLEAERVGLEGQSSNSQLLSIRAELVPQQGGTMLTLMHRWGPRPLLAQLLARADLWGSVHRIKGVAETGVPNFRADALISAAVASLTGVASLYAFAYAFGWTFAGLLVVALLVHEFGHLLAYRLIGQPWGRLVFLPFLGAVAVPRVGFTSQAQIVFSALMGPGFSVLLSAGCMLWVWMGLPHGETAAMLGIVSCALNLFNLLPVEPLDGGVALRSVLGRLMGSGARFGLMAAGALIILAGLAIDQVLLVIFGALAFVFNIRKRSIDRGLEPLSRLGIVISAFSFSSVLAAHATLLRHFLGNG